MVEVKVHPPKVAIVGICGLPAAYGGFETLADNLVQNLEAECEFTIFCDTQTAKLNNYRPRYLTAYLVYLPLKANGIQSVIYDMLAMIYCLRHKHSTILVLGVSGALILPVIKMLTASKIVTNIDGIEWQRSKWGRFAKSFLWLSELFACKFSDTIIADNEGIVNYLKTQRKVDSNLIAYGGSDVSLSPNTQKTTQFRLQKTAYFLTICRIEPENNVELILRGFMKTGRPIIFIGNWQNSSYGRSLFAQYSNVENIELSDPIYDVGYLNALRRECIGYVHGHSAGGTNPALVEAIWTAPQIIAYDCIFNRCTLDNHGKFFETITDLVDVLENFDPVSKSDVLEKLAKTKYKWSDIASQYKANFV